MTEFAVNFPFVEFTRQANGIISTEETREYAARLSQLLQRFRDKLGGRAIVITDWLRLTDTQHGDGTAVDVRLPDGVTERQVYAASQQLEQAGVKWGQLIFYPYGDRHWHISLATGAARNAVLVQLYDTAGDPHNAAAYRPLTPELLAAFPMAPRNGVLEVLADVASSAPTTGTLGAVLFALGVALMLG